MQCRKKHSIGSRFLCQQLILRIEIKNIYNIPSSASTIYNIISLLNADTAQRHTISLLQLKFHLRTNSKHKIEKGRIEIDFTRIVENPTSSFPIYIVSVEPSIRQTTRSYSFRL